MAAGDEALTRFANSEIHQNVAESDVADQPALRPREAGRRRVVRPDGPGGPAPPGRDGRPDRRDRRGDADWAGLPAAEPAAPVVGAFAAGTAEASPELRADGVRAVIEAADLAGVTAYGSFSTGRGDGRGRDDGRHPRSRVPHERPAPRGHDGPRRRDRVRGGGRGRRHAIDAAAVGREAAEKARRSRAAGRAAAGRLPGRARGVRRRRPPRQARVPRLLRPRRGGGTLVLRARQADRQRAGDDRGRRARPGRDAVPASTTRASRRGGS